MDWRKFSNANVISSGQTLLLRFRDAGSRRNWKYSNGYLFVPEPNLSAENNSESDTEYIDYAGEYELKLVNTFGGLFLYIDKESADNYDVEYKSGYASPYPYFNETLSTGIKETILSLDIFNTSHEQIHDYFKLQNKTDPTSQKRKVLLIKEIINKVLIQYNKEDDFRSFYNAWIKFEIILNIVEVRDHFIHNFETFILGLYFLNSFYNEEFLIQKSDKIIYKWTFTSIMHDIGYAVEKSKAVIDKIADLYSDIGINTISNKIRNFNLDISVLNELYNITINKESEIIGECININIRNIIIDKIQNDFPGISITEDIFPQLEKKFNHGLVSSVLLIRHLIETKGINYLKSDSFNEILDSALGILFHHYKPNGKITLSLRKHLMIILLFVVDELQEWSRPLEDYGAALENQRREFEFDQIEFMHKDNDLIFDVIMKINTPQTDSIISEVNQVLSQKKEKLSAYEYDLNNRDIIINIVVNDINKKKVGADKIVLKGNKQLSLVLQ